MRILVTGGTGFFGSHLVERLLEETGVEVYALVREPARLRWLQGVPGVRLLTGDLDRLPALPEGLSCVYHLAGLTKTHISAEYYTVNQEGTANLLKALEGQSARLRFVHLSSLAAIGPSQSGRGVSEDDPPQPVCHYGKSKLLAENEVLKYKDRFSVVLLRAAAIYGPRDEDFLEYFRWIKHGIMALFGPRKLISQIYIRDAVRAAVRAGSAALPSGEIFNIADPEPCGWEDIGRIAARLLGKGTVRINMPVWTAYLAFVGTKGLDRCFGTGNRLYNASKYEQMKADSWVADVRKARKDLGFEVRFSLEQGLAETIAWYLWKRRL